MEPITAEIAAPVTTENAPEEAKPVSTEITESTGKEAVASPAPAQNSDEKAYKLADIIKRVDSKPETKLNDEDQSLYEEYVDNKLQPKARPVSKSKEPEKEVAEKAPEKEVEKKTDVEIPAHIEAAMKEVGAKTPEELQSKIKELRAAVSGKETQAMGNLKQEMARKAENAAALIRDFAKGVPKAVQFVKEAYGVDLPTNTKVDLSDAPFDADADLLTGGALSKMHAQLKAALQRLDDVDNGFQGHQKTLKEQAIKSQVASQVVDEMIGIAGNMEGLKDIPNLRNAVIDRVMHGKVDPRLDAFNELFDIAKEAQTDLKHAYLIKRGRDAELLIAQAREDGRSEAYNHKPNKSLSAVTTEDAETQQFTDSQIDAMEKNFRLIPDEWLKPNGDLNPAKVPKKYWSRFDLE